ncbi:response regulator [uncultured Sphingomonas sp.]|uniref:response regulator n=1 Tax=uncultured Sphingomonas sp. TaxID=158754 RepID=UPI0025E819DD|nr:response regulator [uncultured Sphingomonas sp.]
MIHPQIESDTIVRRPLILIVDDVPANRFIVQRRLERMNYDCMVADGGRTALQMIKTTCPSLVLLDFMMPEICGLTVLRQLRANPDTASLPVIMLTARTDAEAVVASLKEGADDYVHKPIDFTVLKARIEAHLQRGEQSRALREANGQLDGRAASRALELGEVRALLHKEMDRADRLESQLTQGGGGVNAALPEQIASGFRRIVELCNQGGHAEPHVTLVCVEEIERIAVAALRKMDASGLGH